MSEKIFSRGIWVKEPRANAPDFVFANISVKYDDFVSWAGQNVNKKGYVNLSALKSKDASKGIYCELNTFEKDDVIPEPKQEDYKVPIDGVPF
jgi:hypothetical protein